jgi:hypothetical protein
MASKTEWTIKGREAVNCNCAYGCPCQFNSLPTDGTCHAVISIAVDEGRHGQTRLDGLNAVYTASWPGPIHKGNGTVQIIIDERASPDQRRALDRILRGEDTEDMATFWWVFGAMSPTKLETLYRPIDLQIDIDKRIAKLRVDGLAESDVTPIKNPVTGADHRARFDMPNGFEFRFAEVANGSSKLTAGLTMQMSGTHSHLARLSFNQNGVVA